MRPVRHGMIRYEELFTGRIDLADIARCNEYLIMEADNETLARQCQRSDFGR